MAIEKEIKINGEDIVAKSSERYFFVKMECLNVLNSYRFLDSSSDTLTKTLKI